MDRLRAQYLIETPLDLEAAANVLAGEQSSGTFVHVPGESASLTEQFGARVEQIAPLDDVDTPSLPGSMAGSRYQRAEITVSWSVENFGTNLPAICSTLQGNLYELRQFSGLRLTDIEFPASFADAFSGPGFGIEGTRKLADVHSRPLIGTIIKPSVGLPPAETANMVAALAEAGVDFIKDDELMADPPHSPFEQRVEAIMRVINDHADATGKKPLYAFNISDELDRMQEHYDMVLRHGGTCVMLSLNTVGLAGVKKICDRQELPVHGHRNGWGMLSRHPALGIDFTAYQKLWRLAGVDHIHVNGIDNKFCESNDSVVRSINACHQPLLGGFPILPVISSGQWGGQALETHRRIQNLDLLYLAGGGIAAHPEGMQGGVKAIRDAWQAAEDGLSLEQAIEQSPELALAAEKFGDLTSLPDHSSSAAPC